MGSIDLWAEWRKYNTVDADRWSRRRAVFTAGDVVVAPATNIEGFAAGLIMNDRGLDLRGCDCRDRAISAEMV